MKKSEVILRQQSTRLFFKNGDTDFFFNWLLGIGEVFGFSYGEPYYLVQRLGKSPKPSTQKKVSPSHAGYLAQKLGNPDLTKQSKAQYYLAQTYSIRSAIQLISPFSREYLPTVRRMEEPFKKATYSLKAPTEELTVYYQKSYLPGYYPRSGNDYPTLITISGGDAYQEDLFYFAGYPEWKRGHSVLVIDLPGQGSNPSRELTLDVNATTPISLCIDWLENKNPKLNHLAIYGASGGGYFTTQAVEQDTRIQAWIASTPTYDITEISKKELGSSLKTPSWLVNVILRLAGSLDESVDLNFQRYTWRLETTDFKKAIDGVLERTKAINYRKVQRPCLFIMGEGGNVELQRQAKVVYEAAKSKNSHARLQIFKAESGMDVHYQVNNLRLVHNVASGWLDTLFE